MPSSRGCRKSAWERENKSRKEQVWCAVIEHLGCFRLGNPDFDFPLFDKIRLEKGFRVLLKSEIRILISKSGFPNRKHPYSNQEFKKHEEAKTTLGNRQNWHGSAIASQHWKSLWMWWGILPQNNVPQQVGQWLKHSQQYVYNES